MKVLYFAWLKEKVGIADEEVAVPEEVRTVRGLIAWLSSRSPGHAAAFADLSVIRCAVNQDFAGLETPLAPGDEVAFFPPVTGG